LCALSQAVDKMAGLSMANIDPQLLLQVPLVLLQL
jgi:hypothetical protein